MPSCGTLQPKGGDGGGGGGDPQPDPSLIAVQNCSCSKTSIKSGESVLLEATVRNDNSVDAHVETTWRNAGGIRLTSEAKTIGAGSTNTYQKTISWSQLTNLFGEDTDIDINASASL